MNARLLGFLLFLIPAMLPAQDAADAKKNSAKDLLIRFTAFGVPGLDKELALRAEESIGEPFLIPGNGFSDPQPSPGKSRGLQLGIPAVDEETPFKPLLAINLPAQGNRFLVILFPTQKGIRSTVIRADDPDFRRGDIMIFNLSAQPLAADLGGTRLRFAPGSETAFRPRKDGDTPNYQVSFYFEKDNKPKLFAANMWPHFDHKRAFVFLYVDPATSRPTYRSLDEFTEWLDRTEKEASP